MKRYGHTGAIVAVYLVRNGLYGYHISTGKNVIYNCNLMKWKINNQDNDTNPNVSGLSV